MIEYLRIKAFPTGFTVEIKLPEDVNYHIPDDNLSVICTNKEYILYEQYGCLTIRNKRWKENIVLRNGILDNNEMLNEYNIKRGLLDFIEELIRESDKARMLEELKK